MKKYKVKSIWRTLQGEGYYAGRPAIFIRFVGCNLWSGYAADRERDAHRNAASCPLWCDTDFTKEGSTAYTLHELVDAIRLLDESNCRFCVITGGEPLLHIDAQLIKALQQSGFEVAVETNGTVALSKNCRDEESQTLLAPDWIACSPKLGQERLELEFFDELKLVVPSYQPQDFGDFLLRQRRHMRSDRLVPLLWLQAEDGPRLKEAIRLAVDIALDNPAWRVGAQTHKLLDVE